MQMQLSAMRSRTGNYFFNALVLLDHFLVTFLTRQGRFLLPSLLLIISCWQTPLLDRDPQRIGDGMATHPASITLPYRTSISQHCPAVRCLQILDLSFSCLVVAPSEITHLCSSRPTLPTFLDVSPLMKQDGIGTRYVCLDSMSKISKIP